MMLAGIEGNLKNQIDPGDGVDVDLFELPADELAKIDTVPSSLNDSLNALKADKDYLLLVEYLLKILLITFSI
ncbi:MAG: hypothetical protein Ct9H90mP3_6800 [Flammeovirgaceae bacterium]|nr:MAG: hypothetical protein Ct9H90mP3_6800 [Flammeovirgaceae bacterium]